MPILGMVGWHTGAQYLGYTHVYPQKIMACSQSWRSQSKFSFLVVTLTLLYYLYHVARRLSASTTIFSILHPHSHIADRNGVVRRSDVSSVSCIALHGIADVGLLPVP